MRCRLTYTDAYLETQWNDIGINLLKDVIPVLTRYDGIRETVNVDARGEEWFKLLTSDSYHARHIDFLAPVISLSYDLKDIRRLDQIVLYTSRIYPGFRLNAWGLYASNDLETLYCPENRITGIESEESNADGDEIPYARLLRLEGCFAQYFGFKTHGACEKDDIVRLAFLGVYNDEYSEQRNYLSKTIKADPLRGISVSLDEDADGESAYLTDGIVFDDKRRITFSGVLQMRIAAEQPVDTIVLVGSDIMKCRVFEMITESAPFKIPVSLQSGSEPASCGRSTTILKLRSPITAPYIGIECEGDGAGLDEVAVYSNSREISVQTETVITEDFLGVGANVVPTEFMPESLSLGFNEVYWAIHRKRVLTAAPHVVRLWFQLDWIVKNEGNYLNGVFDFETPKMSSVFRHLELLREAGSEIEFNFGWKAGREIQDWFAFESVQAKHNSAPRDLKPYARACAATLHELIVVRGYNNIRHLTFYNEPTYGDKVSIGEFLCPYDDKLGYWIEMLRETDCAMALNGTKGLVKVWGCEQAGNIPEWMEGMNERAGDLLDMHTFHYYGFHWRNHSDLLALLERIKNAAGGKPFCMTESASLTGESYLWNNNDVALFIAAANSGCCGTLYWTLSGVPLTDPLEHIFLAGTDLSKSMFDYLPLSGAASVNDSFYAHSLLLRYIPNHSKTLHTALSAENNDCRVAAFSIPDGGVTVVVESNVASFDRPVTVKFDCEIPGVFYKYVYNRPECRGTGVLIPPCRGKLTADGCIRDILPREHTMTVYTTLPPIPQILLRETEYMLTPGESIRISAETVDCIGRLQWSVSAVTGRPGTVSEDGLFTADINACKGDMAAVTVSLTENSSVFNAAIVRIKPD